MDERIFGGIVSGILSAMIRWFRGTERSPSRPKSQAEMGRVSSDPQPSEYESIVEQETRIVRRERWTERRPGLDKPDSGT